MSASNSSSSRGGNLLDNLRLCPLATDMDLTNCLPSEHSGLDLSDSLLLSTIPTEMKLTN